MTGGTCVNLGSITSGTDFTGLAAITLGTQGAQYWVMVTANATSGFAANPSAVAGPQRETSQVKVPTGVTVHAGSGHGNMDVTFATSGSGVASTNLQYRLNNSGPYTTITGYLSGTNISGLTHGGNYYVIVTAVGSAGYLSNAAPQVNGSAS